MAGDDALTIHEAAETTGWSARMLRYVERSGLVVPPRSAVRLPALRAGRAAAPAHAAGAARALRGRPLGRRLRAAPAPRRATCARRSRSGSRPSRSARRTSTPPTGCAGSRTSTRGCSTHDRLETATTMTVPSRAKTDFKVADLSLADFGRKEIRARRARDARPDVDPRGVRRQPAAQGRAHHGLAAHDDPDRGADRDADRARRRGPLGLAATSSRRRTTPPPRSPSARRARPRTRRASRSSPGRARRSRSTGGAPSRRCTGPASDGPNMILDDGGDATLLVHKGTEFEAGRRRAGPDARRTPRSTASSSALLKRTLERGPAALDQDRPAGIKGVTEETTTGVHRLYEMHGGRRRCCSRRSTSTTRSRSRSSTTSTAAATRSSTASTAPPT